MDEKKVPWVYARKVIRTAAFTPSTKTTLTAYQKKWTEKAERLVERLLLRTVCEGNFHTRYIIVLRIK